MSVSPARGQSRVQRLRAIATVLAAALTATLLVGAPAQAAPVYSNYVMGYFTESPDSIANNYGLHLAVSSDGHNWAPLNQNAPVVTPTAGTLGLRDPYIFRKQDGTFVVLATDLAGTNFAQNNQYIHAWDSTDLTSFSNYRRIKVHSLATHSWAPEAFWDPARNQYGIIYSAFNGTRDVIMVNYTSDFVNVSAPQTWFDPGANIIDATVTVDNGTYYMYYKRDNQLFGAKSTSLAPGAFNNATYTTGYAGSGFTEAPIVVKSLNSNQFTLWGDVYTPVNGKFTAWSSSSIGTNSWTALSQRAYTQPLNSKHATIQPITSVEFSNLVTRWGLPSWNRLKSFNYPDHFVRHAVNVARIDQYPFDPFADSQFRMVAGLAGTNTVSFRSINFPDMFLRHEGFEVKLATNDGSAAFAADSSFTRVAGLADSSWSTFTSFNYPDRVIRHTGFVLRIDPITATSSRTAREDATFGVRY